jgi:hypothetical protein
MQKYSLEALARELLGKAAGGSAGRAAQTVMGGHEKVLRQTVIAMVAGAELRRPAHRRQALLTGAAPTLPVHSFGRAPASSLVFDNMF